MNQPNIFDCGTTELTQDAFMVWLALWADSQYQNEPMHKAGQHFLQSILQDKYDTPIKTVNAGRQWHNMDVWIEINDDLFIIIENKKGTQAHGNQLQRYREYAQEYYKNTNRKIVCVYIQSIIESISHQYDVKLDSYKYIGFKIFKSIIDTGSKDISNDILEAYKIHLQNHLDKHKWNNEQVNEEGWFDWYKCYGLYSFLEEKDLKGSPWGYSANAGGGNQWFILEGTWEKINIPNVIDCNHIGTHLQITNDKKGFRLVARNSTDNKNDPNLLNYRHKLLSYLTEEYKKIGIKIEKDGDFRRGVSVSTIRFYLGDNTHLPLNSDKTIDYTKLLSQLTKVKELFLSLSKK